MSSRKTLAVIFIAAVTLPFGFAGLRQLALQDKDNMREAVFSKAEAFSMATQRLYSRDAISSERLSAGPA